MQKERANFGSKLGVILATAGSAVGLGNVWRFPYMTGQNGGSAFIILYLLCVLALGIPCMISEFIIGRHAAANTARAYSKLSGGKPWKWVGFMSVLTGLLITCYYCIVSGWCFQYVYASVMGQLNGNPEEITAYFSEFSQHPVRPVFWAVLFVLVCHFVIIHGVREGIEKASKMMMPLLFILLLVIVVCSCLLPGAGKGITFLFKPDFSVITPNVFLNALGQSFYSLSIGMGCICTYASYFSRTTDLSKSAIQISLIDSLIAILAGLMIFPAAFSVGVNPDSGPSLIFITLPNVFNQAFASMPAIGYVISLAFYILLSLAALTSLMSLHEVSTAFLQEELKTSRGKAALIVTVVCLVMGTLCSLSLGDRPWLTFFGKSLFDHFDFITGQILLPAAGFFTCLFIGWYIPRSLLKDEYTNWGTLKTRGFGLYYNFTRYVCPLLLLLIFLHQMGVVAMVLDMLK